jgi:ABC-2 type transport system permease protein
MSMKRSETTSATTGAFPARTAGRRGWSAWQLMRAELSKTAHRPAAWVLVTAAVVLNLTFSYLIPYLAYRGSGSSDLLAGASPEQILASVLPQNLVLNTIGGYPIFAGALALAFGALVFGSEHTWGTVKTLFSQGPSRGVVLAAQWAATALAVALAVVLMLGISAGVSAGLAIAEGQPLTWPAAIDLLKGAGAGWLVLTMWATLGAVLGWLLRSVALPIGLGIVWALGLENLVSAMAGSLLSSLQPLRDMLPGVNAGSLVAAVSSARATDAPPGVTATVEGGRALLTLTAYVLVGVAAIVLSGRRRDVT